MFSSQLETIFSSKLEMIFFLSYHEFDEFGGCDNVVENNEQKSQIFVDKSLKRYPPPAATSATSLLVARILRTWAT